MDEKFRRILSIDWDYFFPDSMPYDMGHSERHGPLMQEILWSTRAASHHQVSGQSLLDHYIPTIPPGFWDIVKGVPKQVYVADSHLKIWVVISPLLFAQVTSLDAHHDCAYNPQRKLSAKTIVDCGNWGYWSRQTFNTGRLDLWYPGWRKSSPEQFGGRQRAYKPTTLNYGLPAPAEYDFVFICRSGAWTPPWFDKDFLWFSQSLGRQKCLENVEPRDLTMEKARETAAHWEAQKAELLKEVTA